MLIEGEENSVKHGEKLWHLELPILVRTKLAQAVAIFLAIACPLFAALRVDTPKRALLASRRSCAVEGILLSTARRIHHCAEQKSRLHGIIYPIHSRRTHSHRLRSE